MNSSPVPSEQLALFQELTAELARDAATAGADVPSVTFNVRLAGLVLRVRQTGGTPEVFRAWDPFRIEQEAEPDLTLTVWDAATGGRPFPNLPLEEHVHQGRGRIQGFEGSDHAVSFCPGARVLTLLDPDARQAWYWTPDFSRLPFYERAAPARHLLSAWFREQGRMLIHGAALALDADTGLLLTGPGGSGKSCTSLTGLQRPLRFLGDDYTVLEPSEVPFIHSVYASAKVVPDQLARLGLEQLDLNYRAQDDEKAVLFPPSEVFEPLLPSARIRAVVVPVVAHEHESRFVPLSPARALMALAPSSIFQLPHAGKEEFAWCSKLVRQVPVFHLRLSPDPDEIREKLLRFLKEEGGKPCAG